MKTDIITKAYVQDAGIFADIFNGYIYGGRQVIQPEQLSEKDSTELALPYGADGALVPVQKFRDVKKLYSAKTDGRVQYILFGAENQMNVHYAMPVKNALYDVMEYAKQVEEAARSHRREMEKKRGKRQSGTVNLEEERPNSGEFLSGFWKRDKLIPTVTLTIHFGAEKWDGPLSLYEMLDVPDPAILEFIDNYHVHLISPMLMTDEEIMKFQSSLREVMFFIKYSKDKAKLDGILEAHQERFSWMERRAADIIKAVTNSDIKYDEGEEHIDMCQAIQDMRRESREEGIAEGIAQGITQGITEGIAMGETQKAQQMARNFYEMGIDIERIAQGVGYALETVQQWLGL